MDDNAETILQRLGRGTGYRGLGGIWPVREFKESVRFIRPLLDCKRKEIIEYLTGHQLDWQTDKTNQDTSFRRNFIRHKLMPELQKNCRGDLVEHLYELSNHARQLQLLVKDKADKAWPMLALNNGNILKLELEGFLTQPRMVQLELIRRSLIKIGSGEKYLTRKHYNRTLKLASNKTTGK